MDPRELQERMNALNGDVYELTPAIAGHFGLVFFFGVLYHLKYPLLALERIAGVTRGSLLLETHLDALAMTRAAMAFYPGAELEGDGTNWCGPNPEAVEAMLRVAGFANWRPVSYYLYDHAAKRRNGNTWIAWTICDA